MALDFVIKTYTADATPPAKGKRTVHAILPVGQSARAFLEAFPLLHTEEGAPLFVLDAEQEGRLRLLEALKDKGFRGVNVKTEEIG